MTGAYMLEKAMEQEFRYTRDPRLEYVPRQRLHAARAYMEDLQTRLAGRTTALAWQERGPSNVAGRTRSMLVDKADATGNTVFAGSVSGGLFKTTNFLSATPTWSPVNDFLPNLAITAMVQDPSNHSIMYAGTGEGWFNIDGVLGNGIYKSTDGGLTWAALPSTVTPTGTFQYVQDLAITNTGILYASLRNQNNHPSSTSTARGVQRSTDGGLTWTQVLGAPLINPSTGSAYTTGRAADIEVSSNGDMYASLGLVGSAATDVACVMKSTFATHGANTGAAGTWLEVTPTTGTIKQRTEIILAPSDPQRVYLLMQDKASQKVEEVYRSNDGGANWTALGEPTPINGGAAQTWFNLIGAVDPANPDILVIGGLHLAKSTNGGTSWSQITNSSIIHVDQHYLQYIGSDKLVIGNDGGVFYSGNINSGSPTFSNKNNGYNVTQYYACDYHPTNANYFLAGAQDNGTQRFLSPGINTTSNVTGGDGGFCHIDKINPDIQISSFFGSNYAISVNGFASYTQRNFNPSGDILGQFINPTDYDANAKILYASGNAGTYTFVNNINNPGAASLNTRTIAVMGAREVTAVKVDPSAPNTIYIGASFGSLSPQVLKISNANAATPTVMNIGNIGTLANTAISSIDIDPSNPNHLVVTLSNYGIANVWESTDGGGTFTNIEGNLPDMPVRWAVIAPANAQLNGAAGGNGGIILGTELGVWTTSATAGAATQWIPNNDGLANVRTDMLRYRASDNTLVAATHGRGLFTSTVPTVITGVPNVPATKDFIKYISAEGGNLRIVTGTLQTRTMEIRLLNMQGQVIYRSRTAYQNTVVDMNRFTTGSYIVQIAGDKKEHFVEQIVKR